jgi:prevent-host-death family protein
MREIGTVEARTHLSEILDEVARGEEVLITRRGMPVARLVPAFQRRRAGPDDLLAHARAFAKHQTLGHVYWKSLRDEGRR